MSYDPIASTKAKLDEMVAISPNPIMTAVLAAAHFSDWLRRIKVTVVGPAYVCSYYNSPTQWDVWISDRHPRTYSNSFGGRRF